MTPPLPGNPLSKALAAGDPQAYAALYDRLGPAMFRVAMALLRDRQEAEDSVQDAFVSLVRFRQRIVLVEDLDAYVFAILRNAAGHQAKRRAREGKHLQKMSQNVMSQQLPGPPRLDDLELAVQSLPLEQREVVALKFDAGLTFAQIAQVLGISSNTAASRYRYALKRLKRAMG